MSFYDDWVDPNANFTGGRYLPRFGADERERLRKRVHPRVQCALCGNYFADIGLRQHTQAKHPGREPETVQP